MSNIKITKYRWSSLRDSVHCTIDDRQFYYKYDNNSVCCSEYKLNEIIDWIYYTTREDWYCSYNQTMEEIQSILENAPDEAKQIMEYLKTYNWEEIW